jgi:hypothetical protein
MENSLVPFGPVAVAEIHCPTGTVGNGNMVSTNPEPLVVRSANPRKLPPVPVPSLLGLGSE